MKYLKTYESEKLVKYYSEYKDIEKKFREEVKNIIKKFFEENPEVSSIDNIDYNFVENIDNQGWNQNINNVNNIISSIEKYNKEQILLIANFHNTESFIKFIIKNKINILKEDEHEDTYLEHEDTYLEALMYEQNTIKFGLLLKNKEWQDFQLTEFPESIKVFKKNTKISRHIWTMLLPEIKEKYSDLFDSEELGLL